MAKMRPDVASSQTSILGSGDEPLSPGTFLYSPTPGFGDTRILEHRPATLTAINLFRPPSPLPARAASPTRMVAQSSRPRLGAERRSVSFRKNLDEPESDNAAPRSPVLLSNPNHREFSIDSGWWEPTSLTRSKRLQISISSKSLKTPLNPEGEHCRVSSKRFLLHSADPCRPNCL
jgi:hypothetical protein